MACYDVRTKLADGTPVTAIVCTRGTRKLKCTIDGCGNAGGVLCDFPLRGTQGSRTCSRRMCRSHAQSAGPDRDYCPTHARMEGLAR